MSTLIGPAEETQPLSKIIDVFNIPDTNVDWQSVHDSLLSEKDRTIFDCELLVANSVSDDPHVQTISVQLDKCCMTNLLLLDNTKVLSVFDTGSTVNILSDEIIASSAYLSTLPIRNCPTYTIHNTSSIFQASKFIELCFKLKGTYILHTTALVVPDLELSNIF